MATKTELFKRFCKKAVKLGARDAKVIAAKSIVTEPWVRRKCQYGCSGYGRTLTCPPYSPVPEETRVLLDSYKKAILIHADGKKRISDIIYPLEREVFLSGFYKAFGMGAGPCRLCKKECALEPGSCRHPDEARPSMEACGIDVFATARGNGFPIEVAKSYRARRDHYGLILTE